MSQLTDLQAQVKALSAQIGALQGDTRLDTAHSRATRQRAVNIVDERGECVRMPGATATQCISAAVGTGGTAIPHYLANAPTHVSVTPYANVAVWQSKAPDDKFIYLKSYADTTVTWRAEV